MDEHSGEVARFILAKCPRCHSPLLLSQRQISPNTWSDPSRIYPQYEYQPSWDVPEPIRETFEEGLTSYRAGAHTPTVIMCRKTLEGVAEDHGIEERTLVNSLKKMRDDGVIENRLYEWADELRLAGNEAAHDVEVRFSQKDATNVVEFTHAILEYVYTFRKKFEEFRARRRKDDGE